MSTNRSYHTWEAEIRELRPEEHARRRHIFVWFLAGLFLSRSVHLSYVAKKIPGQATQTSKKRRLRRLLANPALQVRSWYRAVAKRLLQEIQAHDLPVRLVVDLTA